MNVQDVQTDQSWRTQPIRQKVIAQIEDAVRQSGNPTTKTSMEMENHVFTKARTKEEYLSLVARLIIHVREMNSKKERVGGPGMVGPQIGGLPPGTQGMGIQSQPGVPDPINALQNLARQGTTASGVMPGTPQIQMAGVNQQAHPVMSQGMMRAQHPGMTTVSGGQLLSFSTSGGPISAQQQQLGTVQQPQMMMNQQNAVIPEAMPSSMQLQFQKIRAQHQQQQQQQQQGMRPQAQIISNHQYGGGAPTSMPENVLMAPGQQMNPVAMPRQPNQQSFIGPGPANMPPMPNSGLGNQQMSMSPAGQHLQPSPAGQMMHSPASNMSGMSVRAPGSLGPTPSPNTSLNTPGAPSPARQFPDNQAYMEKLKSLQKYIEPLRRMIYRIDKEDNNKKDLSRLRNLLNNLSNPSPLLTMETLMKCETVLEKLDLTVRPSDVAAIAGATLSPALVPPLPGSKPQEQNMCQLLLDAVANHIKYPTFNHTLQRTFGPALTAIHGPTLRPPSPPQKKMKKKEEEKVEEIPDLVQGEIARLDQRFKVSLDQIQHPGSKIIHLICQLDDRNLPCVPPISISIPENYPDFAPKFDINEEEYNSTPLLERIKQSFSLQLKTLPNKYSVTSLLDTWEMSVRQACAPKTILTQPITA